MFRSFAALAVMTLAACAPSDLTVPQAARATVATTPEALPPLRRFSGAPDIRVPVQPNGQLARDFMALTFQLETGRQINSFTRFEGPITIAVEGEAPPTLGPDLDDLIARFRKEARIDISRAAEGEMGSITIAALPRATLQRVVPGAACFVVPRVTGWADYMSKRFGPATDWTTLKTRSRASVFLPSDVSPQEIRDCLHEEVAQALGPLNDLYRLPFSVFNDDNTHAVLTRYDMLLLRATYHADLTSGMTQEQVAARLPAVLAQVNPRGRMPDRSAITEASLRWTRSVQGAFDPRSPDNHRLTFAKNAVTLAQAEGWGDTRLALSHLALGRAALAVDGDVALAAFLEASRIYHDLHGDSIHSAQIAVQLGAFAISSGQAEGAITLLDRAIPVARGAQNASTLATLMLLRAEATRLLGAPQEAERIRGEALAWGRYAWGDAVLRRRTAEVAGLAPGA